MDRPKRAASKVTDYRKYHLSGDLNISLSGRVESVVGQFEERTMSQLTIPDNASTEELKQLVELSKANSQQRLEEMEQLRLRNELEAQALEEKRWDMAMKGLKEAKETMLQEHEKQIQEMDKMRADSSKNVSVEATEWLRKQLKDLTPKVTSEEEKRKLEEEEKQKANKIQEIKQQQAELQKQLSQLTGENPEASNIPRPVNLEESQGLILEQLKAALSGNRTDPNKALIRALTNTQNRMTDPTGVNSLKPELMGRILTENNTSMEDWLATLNRQEEGELEFTQSNYRCETDGAECKHTKTKSGMLDRATSTVIQKQIWPQKNLGEEWVEDEVDFKHIRFEHMVAGETRTIERCTEPAQILGRLRLLRRLAYLKLRGYEWHLLRRMYAAILGSIETGEYAWDSNFDRFETILYRRAMTEPGRQHNDNRNENPIRKRFCRDYNKPEGCTKTSPHVIWAGSGPNATKRTVHHICAACIIKDKQSRDHPEGHPECPHKD